jgi:hypothetical protein
MSEKKKIRESKPQMVRPRPGQIDEKVSKVGAALTEARQRVMPLVKREREGEQVPSDLLNLRLKSYAGPRS